MKRSPHSVEVTTAAPLLRVALGGLLLVAALAGVLVTSGVRAGWFTLAFVLVAGPVLVLLDGRARGRASRAVNVEAQVSARDRFPSSASPGKSVRHRHRAAA